MIAILPIDTDFKTIDHAILRYVGHDQYINIDMFDEQCKKIEELRQ